jgi:hypothetical protein
MTSQVGISFEVLILFVSKEAPWQNSMATAVDIFALKQSLSQDVKL